MNSNTPNPEHGDKRSVSTDALETLGMVHVRPEHRDAIHLAVEPVTAGQELQPGEHIGLDFDHKAYRRRTGIKLVGIVDPFLDGPVQAGQQFWLVVYPRKVTSLRHVWSHPDFPEETPAPLGTEDTRRMAALLGDNYHRSHEWMEQFLEKLNAQVDASEGGDHISMDELMGAAEDTASSSNGRIDTCISRGGTFQGFSVPHEFWDHFERIRGKTVPARNRNDFFSCSC